MFVAVGALYRVTSRLKTVKVPEDSFASCEKAWSVQILNRMMLAICFSCILSTSMHILGIPTASLLVPHDFQWAWFLDPGIHAADIAVELTGLMFIGGVITPQEPCAKQRRPCLRGLDRLTEELPENTENAKVRELAIRSIDVSTLLDFYGGLDVMTQ